MTLEQHIFELLRSIYMLFFSVNTINAFSLSYTFNNIFFSLYYFLIRVQYIIHKDHKVCINRKFILLVRFLLNSRLLIIKFFWGRQNYIGGFNCAGRGSLTPTPLFKDPTVILLHSYLCIQKFSTLRSCWPAT